jgi:hypothetical protein
MRVRGLARLGGGFALLGATLAAAGICLWSAALTLFEPAVHSPGQAMSSLTLWAKDLRWSALLLGIGGLVLLTRGARLRTRLIAVPMLSWVAADVLLDRFDVSGWLAGTAAAVAVGAVVVAATRRARSDPLPEERDDELAIVYSGASLGVAIMILPAVRWLRAEVTPPALAMAAVALGPLLVLAAVAVAVSATPRVSRRRFWAGLGLVVAIGVAQLAFELDRVGAAFSLCSAITALSWPVAGGVLGCALLGGPVPGLRRGRLYYAAIAPVFALLAPMFCLGIIFVTTLAQALIYGVTGDYGFVDGVPAALSGLLLGVALSALTLVPHFLAPEPTGPPPLVHT